jgi:hypothetical protein
MLASSSGQAQGGCLAGYGQSCEGNAQAEGDSFKRGVQQLFAPVIAT